MTNDPKLNAVRLVNDFSFAMLEEYIRHLPEKRESWRDVPLKGLKRVTYDTMLRFWRINNRDKVKARDELIDIANLAMLLWHRLGEEEK